MPDTSTADPGKPMKQPSDDLSKVMGQLSVTTEDLVRTSPSLSDMPIDVVGMIVEKSDYKQQLKLRKVSKSLRIFVDKHKPACKSIQVNCFKEWANIIMNDHSAIYKSGVDDDDGSFWAGYFTETILLREEFKKAAFDDLTFTLKNPKLQLEEFSVSFGCSPEIDEYYNEIRNVLELLDHKLSVKEVDLLVSSPSNLLSILPYLKPGVLEKIALIFDYRAVDWRTDSTGMDQIAHLEQWKQAEELELRDPFDDFPMEYATHFKRFIIREYVINTNTFDRIKKFLSKLKDFEYCRISHSGRDNIEHFQKMIGTPVPPNMSHYSMPDSDSCLEFSIDSYGITIVKKICHLH